MDTIKKTVRKSLFTPMSLNGVVTFPMDIPSKGMICESTI